MAWSSGGDAQADQADDQSSTAGAVGFQRVVDLIGGVVRMTAHRPGHSVPQPTPPTVVRMGMPWCAGMVVVVPVFVVVDVRVFVDVRVVVTADSVIVVVLVGVIVAVAARGVLGRGGGAGLVVVVILVGHGMHRSRLVGTHRPILPSSAHA